VIHGSIGTFVPRESADKKANREHWSYKHNTTRSVWPELDKVLATTFMTDSGRKTKIVIPGVDIGHYNLYAYPYIDKSNFKYINIPHRIILDIKDPHNTILKKYIGTCVDFDHAYNYQCVDWIKEYSSLRGRPITSFGNAYQLWEK